uniref:Ig-like domain-containing protein n=1 Tax=Esox lucius TaxID=8010 RepID=A0A6Q2Z6L3_ESOLU
LDFVLSNIIHALSAGVHCEELTQPPSMTVQPGQPLTISCKVSYSVSSYYTHWIRQPAGKALEWIGYIYSGGSTGYKDSLKSKFSITRDTSSNTLFLKGQNLQTEDTAVYYCARDTVIQTSTTPLQKQTSPLFR